MLGASVTLLLLFIFGIGWPPDTFPEPLPIPDDAETAIVTLVVDGDTIQIDSGERVRYIGIDTPEITHSPVDQPECFGPEATARNRELVLGKEVTLVKDDSDRDRYGRLLRYVYVDGELVSYVLTREGYARAIFIKPDVRQYPLLKSAQDSAQSAGIGLWGACS